MTTPVNTARNCVYVNHADCLGHNSGRAQHHRRLWASQALLAYTQLRAGSGEVEL
jgi:hypothetical protein